ncbi:hypothetical protein VTK73DRAFT_5196 [Phialemonium thermophilum]|uniref:Uncharacterized protein n=1 Tax=Phialemonium thermophilum TaxID=223376 RepID=A0ABR3WPW1_9PEZI
MEEIGLLAQTEVQKPRKAASIKLFLLHELPAWQREINYYIETGHSLSYLHNETVNILSHGLGALLFFAIPVYVFNTEIPARYVVATTADKIVCCIYFIGVAVCFVFSAAFHIFMNHSEKAFALGMKLDFQGIILLMWGANIPLIYYGFYCTPRLRIVHWTLISFLAVCCSLFTFQPVFSQPRFRPVRAATSSSLALATFVPVVHGIALFGYAVQARRVALRWVVCTLAFNAMGAAAYASKFPEKWFPRRFDIFGASHQIMHVMVLIAGIAYASAVLESFDFLHEHLDAC